MPETDPRVDAYIEKSAEFARPILRHLRKLVHQGCPEIEETIKWGFPHFVLDGIVCSMAAFKAHCAFGFWRGAEVVARGAQGAAMGQFGRIERLSDLPPDREIVALVRRAVELEATGPKQAPPRKHPKPEIAMPEDFAVALAKRGQAATRATWEKLAPSQRREYLEWITGAKGAATRARRLATTLEWLAEGKSRNWKYAK
jgi:hypothetical protein